MTLTVTQEGFNEIWTDWESLLSECAKPTVFETPLWHRAWWDEEEDGQTELRLMAIRDNGTLVGVAPLMCRDDTLMSLGDPDLWDYQTFVTADGRESELYQVLFDYLVEQPWHKMELSSLPEGSPSIDLIPEMARSKGYSVDVSDQDVSPGLPLPSSWDDYMAGLSKKSRHELRRKFRRLENNGTYKVYSVNGESSLNGSLDDFFRMMRESRQDKAIFLTPKREQFFRHMAEEMAHADVLRLFFMEVSGERVASAMCFDYGQVRFLYNAGYNPEYAPLSVGLLLKTTCLQQAIEQDMDYFDFLRGDERYKYELGAQVVRVHRLVVQR